MTTVSLPTDAAAAAAIAEDAVAADAALIPYVTPAEAQQLAQEELRRLLALLKTLDDTDWHKPTACTAWNVRDMVAHQAAHMPAAPATVSCCTSTRRCSRSMGCRRTPSTGGSWRTARCARPQS